MKDQIGELNAEYASGMKAAAVLQRRAAGGEQRVALLNRTIQRHERDIAKLKSTIARFSRDVENIVSAPGGSPSAWAEGLLNLYRDYVTNSDGKGKIQGPDEATQAEFNRQRQFMERAMEALKKGAKRSEDAYKAVKKKTASENGVLVAEINQLRKESRSLKNQIGVLENALENAKRGKSGKTVSSQNTYDHFGESRSENPVIHGNVSEALRQLSAPSSSNASEIDELDQEKMGAPPKPRSSSTSSLRPSTAVGSLVERRSLRSRMRPSTAGTAGIQNRSYSTTMLRPKAGGRPLTAAQRRRRMPTGPSLSRSMQVMRANQSAQQLEQLKAQNSRLISQNMFLSRKLTQKQVPSSIAEGKQGGVSSPPSAAILSRYSNSAKGGKTQRKGESDVGIENMFPKGGTRRNQQLSPLVKETLRVA